ncbi:ATP-binding protein [Desulfosarcina ovata]|uniref:histidine kinase n=1 Tax=Desulfosarcina ovata subsp. ovata TaxID=2752305 RepID=A0A5K8AEF7_9BACT|nr:ATP-binding protein [Desulfosarcina ovata]BBO90374.1 hypothetical protein DSCOOX_35540 [Desulfosarcina ovata subsp. ovata]
MERDFPATRYPLRLKKLSGRGLTWAVMLILLGLGILPAAAIGFIAYHTAHAHLEQEIPNTVRVIAELKRRELQSFFEDRMIDAGLLGRERSTIAFFEALKRRQAETGAPLAAFVDSIPWTTAVSSYGHPLALHAELHRHNDILLIDKAGNVIFSTARGRELATNLNEPALANTPLAVAVRKTLATGTETFSGFAPDPSDGNRQTAFITAAIGTHAERPAGAIACKIPAALIDGMLDGAGDLAKGLQVFLVDADLKLLAGNAASQQSGRIRAMDTAVTRQWLNRQLPNAPIAPLGDPLTYVDAKRRPHTGVYAEMIVSGKPHALIAEIDRKTALAGIHRLRFIILAMTIFTGLAVLLVAVLMEQTITGPFRELSRNVFSLAQAAIRLPARQTTGNVIGRLADAFADVMDHLGKLQRENSTQLRLMSDQARLHRLLGGEFALKTLYCRALDFLADILNLHRATFYVSRDDGGLDCTCRFPEGSGIDDEQRVYPGEGRIGQVALEMTILMFRRNESQGTIAPVTAIDQANLVAVPLMLRQSIKGALELEKNTVFSHSDGQFIQSAAEMVAVALHAALVRQQEERLMADNREQAKQLKIREAALEYSSQELVAQNQALKVSENQLQFKQLELEAANAQMTKNAADLEAHMAILEQQKHDIEKQNVELESAHRLLEEKARQLERSSQYKTEFMANISHELRTPLNSILLLSRLLLENKDETLTGRQIEFARTIASAGGDLINLINEILDLAKVESGKISVDFQPVSIQAIADAMQANFTPLAEKNRISFSINMAPDLPEQIITDGKRLNQVIKNFLSNAFKFTSRGSVRLEFGLTPAAHGNENAQAPAATNDLSISVVDTGIGIPADKHETIFEAFQQVDGSTRRNYGGTGLGLSISREFTRLLGGTLTLQSREGHGSRFTIHLPIAPPTDRGGENTSAPAAVKDTTAHPPRLPGNEDAPIENSAADPDDLVPGERTVLVLGADGDTRKMIRQHARQHGFKVLMANRLMTGLHFVDYYLPAAIFSDPAVAGGDGADIMDHMKRLSGIRHVPVFILSPPENDDAMLPLGAAGLLPIPASDGPVEAAFKRIAKWRDSHERTVLAPDALEENLKGRKILLADDDMRTVFAVSSALEEKGVEIVTGKTGKESLDKLERFPDIDLILMDVMIAGMDGYQAIRQIRDQTRYNTVPIFALTAKAMQGDRTKCLDAGADGYLAKPVNLDRLVSMLKIWLDPQMGISNPTGRYPSLEPSTGSN